MTWEQHRYAVERARDRMRRQADEADQLQGGVSLQGVAAASDAEMLDEVADFLESLEGRRHDLTSIGFLEGDARRDAFIRDWNRTIGTVGVFAAQWGLPAPEMLFHPKWHEAMNYNSSQPIRATLIWQGVKIRFGFVEQRDVLVAK
ncbi:hypothetical protein [Novosphingobium sp.]|uniref:hypothetical protein n=1 Tax=Novosphingobium sp. TaxID=1874826 RepID=UPI0035665BA1